MLVTLMKFNDFTDIFKRLICTFTDILVVSRKLIFRVIYKFTNGRC